MGSPLCFLCLTGAHPWSAGDRGFGHVLSPARQSGGTRRAQDLREAAAPATLSTCQQSKNRFREAFPFLLLRLSAEHTVISARNGCCYRYTLLCNCENSIHLKNEQVLEGAMQQPHMTMYADIAVVRTVTGAGTCNQLLAEG
jgi:hypothetical protein